MATLAEVVVGLFRKREPTKTEVIASLRRELTFWFPEAAAMTDEEIEAGAARCCDLMALTCLTVAEAERNLLALRAAYLETP